MPYDFRYVTSKIRYIKVEFNQRILIKSIKVPQDTYKAKTQMEKDHDEHSVDDELVDLDLDPEEPVEANEESIESSVTRGRGRPRIPEKWT